MIEKAHIKKIVEEAIAGTSTFVVNIKITNDNKIIVYADAAGGISIDECARISRFIESKLDRDQEDFELQVSSPGLDQPFKVKAQYEKNLGENIRVVLKDGTTFEGQITEVKRKSIILEWEETYKAPGQKKKQTELMKEEINMDDIASAKKIVSF